MKRILACLLIVFGCLAAQAQIEKGKVLLGGQLLYNSSHTKNGLVVPPDYINTSGAYHILAGKAIKENAVLGIDLSYAPTRFDNSALNGGSTTLRKLRNYKASFFYKQYKKIEGKFYAFGQGNIGYSGSHQFDKTVSGSKINTYDETGGFLSVTAGISYNLFRKFQVELRAPNIFSMSFNHTSFKQNRFSASTGFQDFNLASLGIGFNFIL